MTNNDGIQELAVAQLFENGQYVIPIYQRNYAWGEPEIEQLLQDVLDLAALGQPGSYYLGSLVVYQRQDGIFEIIDGQQRHTTLSIILAVLKHEYHCKEELDAIRQTNLKFDSRPKSDRTLRKLFKDTNENGVTDFNGSETEELHIRAAYDIAKRYLADRNPASIKQLTAYLLNQVKLLRIVVPDNTDLNHFFEVMNNRGEQLEKHEVLKARLMAQLSSATERSVFSSIWDACADMNHHVQPSLAPRMLNESFGAEWVVCPQGVNELYQRLNGAEGSHDAFVLADIIADRKPHSSRSKQSKDQDLITFGSIINFPNFLMQALRVSTAKAIPLDDKRLLDAFEKNPPDHPLRFVLDLLKCRILFDRYIIKRNNDDWALKKPSEDNEKSNYVNSLACEDQNQKLIMLLAMFHVSFPAQTSKQWLNDTLCYLFQTADSNLDVSPDAYIGFLESLSDSIQARILDTPNSAGHLNHSEDYAHDHLSRGTQIHNFIFNRLDYLLWKRLKEGETFPGVDMNYVKGQLRNFRFTFRTSVEHYYPRNPISNERLEKSEALPLGVDSFGNLCLISHSQNSRLNNLPPSEKRNCYKGARGPASLESLKQAFMMSYPQWGPECPEVIAEHERMMNNILLNRDL